MIQQITSSSFVLLPLLKRFLLDSVRLQIIRIQHRLISFFCHILVRYFTLLCYHDRALCEKDIEVGDELKSLDLKRINFIGKTN